MPPTTVQNAPLLICKKLCNADFLTVSAVRLGAQQPQFKLLYFHGDTRKSSLHVFEFDGPVLQAIDISGLILVYDLQLQP